MSRFPRPGRTPRPRPVPTAGPTPSPTPGPGTTFTLTTNIETVPAQGTLPANSTVNGVIATTGSTYQTGDIINANQTSDVLVTVANGGVTPAVVAINNARSAQFRNVAGASQTVNGVLFSGVSQVGSFGSVGDSDLVVSNGDIASTYVLSNPVAQSSGVADLSVGFVNANGTNDTAKFSASNVGFISSTGVVTNASLSVTGNTAESATIATTGTNFFRPTIGTAATSLAITGNGNNEVTLAAGDLTANAKTVSFATATGANALRLGSFVRSGDTYIGGSGVDVLGVSPSGLGATALSVSGFEALTLATGGAGTLGFATAPNFQNVTVTAGTSTGAISLLNAGTLPTVNFVGNGTAASQAFSPLVAVTPTSTVNVNFSNGAASATDYEFGTAQGLVLDGAQNVTFTFAGNGAGANNLDGDSFTSPALTTFTATGTGALGTQGTSVFNLSTNNSAGTGQNTLQLINLGGLTGTSRSEITTANNSFVALTFNASTAGSELNTGAEASTDVVTFNGAAGNDIYAAGGFLGLVNFFGGAGADTVVGNSGIVFAQGGSGADTVTGGSAADTLSGDADNDLITGGDAADTLSGGTGTNTFVTAVQDASVVASANTLASTITAGNTLTFGNGIDTITDFASGTSNKIARTASASTAATTLTNLEGDAASTAFNSTSTAYVLYGTFSGGTFTVATDFNANTANDALLVLGASSGTQTAATSTGFTLIDNLTTALTTADILVS